MVVADGGMKWRDAPTHRQIICTSSYERKVNGSVWRSNKCPVSLLIMASTSKPNDDASAMPPPPIPASTKPAVAKTLQPEFEALAQCLKVRNYRRTYST